jgi:glucosyl-3-phosphoglycerate synthase
VLGKGDAIWRALSVVRGDLVLYLDSDNTDFRPHFVNGLLGPLLSEPGVRFVKGLYSRPWSDGRQVSPDGGARVTELTAKPLLNLHFPGLAGFAQPLAGEAAATRELLCSIPFLTGYAAEIGMLIDVQRRAGLDAMAQVDLGSRSNQNQPLFALGKMAFAVLRAVELRRGQDGAAIGAEQYVHAIRSADDLRLERSQVELVERPPLTDLLRPGARG